MEHFLDNLRAKPETYKRNVALGVAGVVTLGILVFWIGIVRERFSQLPPTAAAKNAPASPFKAISDTAGEGIDAIKGQFEELTKTTK